MRNRMDELGISQAELARRIGVSQPSIYRIVHGEVAGSKHIHRIARELLTTPAYLTGETDDLEANAPQAPELSPVELAWVDYWRALDRDGREVCVRVVQKFLCGRVPEQAAKILKHI